MRKLIEDKHLRTDSNLLTIVGNKPLQYNTTLARPSKEIHVKDITDLQDDYPLHFRY